MMGEAMPTNDAPELSVVAVIVSDTTDGDATVEHLAGCLAALTRQVDPPSLEIIVPYHPPVLGMDLLKSRYPQVRFLAVETLATPPAAGGGREHHDELRSHGLLVTRGGIVALVEDHGHPDPHWAARIVAAHRQRYACIGGAIENGIDAPLNWAVYFCDFARYQNPVPEGPSAYASDANISYKRQALEEVGATWHDSYHERIVNGALMARGETLALSPAVVIYQHRLALHLGSALRERAIWGRSYAATRVRQTPWFRRLSYAALVPLLPLVLLARMARTVFAKGRCRAAFLKAFPLTTMLILAWSWGEALGYMTGRVAPPAMPGTSRDPVSRSLQPLGPDGSR